MGVRLEPAEESSTPAIKSKVRLLALLIFAAAGVSAATVLLWYLRMHGSLEAALDSPLIAATLSLAVVAAMALTVVLMRPESGHLRALIATAAIWSLALLVALVIAWASTARSARQDRWNGTPVTSQADVDAYLAQHLPSGVEPILIPTGVLVKSLEFLNVNNVQVSGFIWQRFEASLPDDFVRGVSFAEAVREAFETEEIYRASSDGVETIGWYFAMTLRQPFAYAEYPLDQQNLRLRIWPRDLARSVVFVPDFESYVSMVPTSLPGVQTSFVYSGWTPAYAGFSYSLQPYTTSLGLADVAGQTNLPELNYNLVLDRDFVGPFVEHLVFAVAVAILLFGLLLLTASDEALKTRFQLSASAVLTGGSGLLFAVILKHNQLRGVVGTQGIAYVEVIPVILYGMIVAVVINAILVAAPLAVPAVDHRNNLWPKLAYWPVLLALLLAATLVVLFAP